ncbi:MAG: TlpA family protein disulfide reductase [Nitrospirae bacterium]|nr:TlpA family protein disulfide reductase [Nitrospirota bacterium]MBF0540518.1 TlpA family protein disulfide reductase [Nitrospirota bacterium]
MRIVKILLTIILLSGLIFIFEFSINSKSQIKPIDAPIIEHKAAENMEVPDFTLYNDANQPIKLSDLKGTVIFLNFWATWCGPCVEEAPSIEALYKKKSTSTDFKIITVVYNDDPAVVNAFMQKNSYTFPVFGDKNSDAAKIFGVTGVPETYIIDKKGILRKKFIGPVNWTDEQTLKLIDDIINGNP